MGLKISQQQTNPIEKNNKTFPISLLTVYYINITSVVEQGVLLSCSVIAQWVHHEGSIWRPIAPWMNALITELHLAPAYYKSDKLTRGHESDVFLLSCSVIAQWVHHEGSIWRPIAPWTNALITELHLAPAY